MDKIKKSKRNGEILITKEGGGGEGRGGGGGGDFEMVEVGG